MAGVFKILLPFSKHSSIISLSIETLKTQGRRTNATIFTVCEYLNISFTILFLLIITAMFLSVIASQEHNWQLN